MVQLRGYAEIALADIKMLMSEIGSTRLELVVQLWRDSVAQLAWN